MDITRISLEKSLYARKKPTLLNIKCSNNAVGANVYSTVEILAKRIDFVLMGYLARQIQHYVTLRLHKSPGSEVMETDSAAQLWKEVYEV